MDFNNTTISIYGERNSKRKDGLPQIQKTPKLPRIVLRNSAGFVLKTETTFQNQIYQAKANLLEPNRRLTDIEWRLPHAPVPSRPDYTRSLDYDDFRLYKKPLKPSDANTTEYADMKFWNYLLPDRRLDQVNVTRKTMEKYCRNGSGVPHPEFMTDFNFFKSAKQLYLAIVSSSSGLDKIIAGFGPWDDRKPFVRNLINKFDYEPIDIKMQKAKELFYLMADKSQKIAPNGYVPLETLCVELSAGGIEQENIEHCKKKFDREGKNYVDFMDWLIYVPLFVEIHTRIISNPFQRYEDPLKPPKELENEN
ncbi:unnamed protein product [Adineta steineri]|uniref:Uncharacterized protein n=1 Tax=Adineta steineri TaxID=433720 RepID=A0A813YF76_9BILA|nr:unnamed protein product [Adineta steineri]